MGKPLVVYSVWALLFLFFVTAVISICLPFHSLAIFVGGAVRLARWQTYPLYVVWSKKGNDFMGNKGLYEAMCTEEVEHNGRKVRKQKEWCEKDNGTDDIQSVAERFCTVLTKQLAPSLCYGYSAAHWVGICLVLSYAINFVCDAAACFLLYEYVNGTFKKKHRQIAMILVSTSTALTAIFLMLYGFLVIFQLSESLGGLANVVAIAVGKSDASTASVGYFIAWFALFIEGIAIILLVFVKSKEEDALEEAKLQMDYDSTYGASPYPVQFQGQYPQDMGATQYQAGYGSYPQAPPSMGQGQGGFGLPPSSGGWGGQQQAAW